MTEGTESQNQLTKRQIYEFLRKRSWTAEDLALLLNTSVITVERWLGKVSGEKERQPGGTTASILGVLVASSGVAGPPGKKLLEMPGVVSAYMIFQELSKVFTSNEVNRNVVPILKEKMKILKGRKAQLDKIRKLKQELEQEMQILQKIDSEFGGGAIPGTVPDQDGLETDGE
jgi:hypothetical protein